MATTTATDLYGYAWGRNVIGNADAAVAHSLARSLDIIAPVRV